jgi:hypothetical protein
MDNLELQRRHDYLIDLTRKLLAAQRAYFKSNKDQQLLMKSKAIEKELDEFVNPKPVTQAQLDFLGR